MSRLRIDRLVSLGIISPALQLLGSNQEEHLPILMYHGIRDITNSARGYFETSTAPEVFSAQMKFLYENGYRAVGMSEAFESSNAVVDHRKRVAITFDDGCQDFFTHALPVLARYGFTATMYVVSGFTGDSPTKLGEEEYLTWDEIREMCAQGIEIGSHTVNHPELWRLSPYDLEYQLAQSKETIERSIGREVRSFAHPFAFPEQNSDFVRRASEMLEKLGYWNAVSTIIGTAGRQDGRYCLPRLPINNYDDLRFFQAKMNGAYDWLHVAQRFYKSWLKKKSIAPRILAGSNS